MIRSEQHTPSTVGTCLFSVGLIATAVLLIGLALADWLFKEDGAAPLRRELAEHIAGTWRRCDLAARLDSSVPCPPSNSAPRNGSAR